MPSSISSFERTIPDLPWRRLALTAALLTLIAAAGWEIRCRAWGYAPTLNDTPELWAWRRRDVKPDSLVIIGDSRPFFDLDLGVLQQGLGPRPIQLALAGSCAFPMLADLADDPTFHGTVICSIVPGMFFAPAGPPVQNSLDALKSYHHGTWAQRSGNGLGMMLEEHVAFLRLEDLTLGELLKKLPIPNRPDAQVGPALPPYFGLVDRERRARMFDQCAQPGPLQDRVKYGWLPLFTPPPPPDYVPREVFFAGLKAATEARFRDTTAAVRKIRARGGRVVFVRFPVSGELKKLEDKLTPRSGLWTRLLKDTGAPGIYFEDYPELAAFECPEWSHLSAPQSVDFSRKLVPHLQAALAR
jgi:hypothetical protein